MEYIFERNFKKELILVSNSFPFLDADDFSFEKFGKEE